ncbi:MAG: phosphoglycerate kinase [Deltaproteobacteria bacterium]|jgi:phosphoglycerate kinase|nr:phosphoglycerate kinase [Deltaproteobacteria bacterium]
MGVQTLDDLLARGVRGQRVFVRSDLNVPLRDGAVADDSRLCASLPTLRRLCEAGARVIVASHLGRPKGERVATLSLRPVAARLAQLLGAGVAFCDECVGEQPRAAIDELGAGRLLLLENLRFYAGEERNDPDFAKALAALADVYVNDAFGTAHRAHASTEGMTAHFDRVAAGDLLNSELRHLQVIREPNRPLLVILGGAKVSDKLSVLEALAPHADVLAIGGAMAYTFIAANGGATGKSLVEPDRFDAALAVQRAARDAGRRLLLPSDHVVADRFEADAPARVVAEIPDGALGLDIGPETAKRYAAEARNARTIFWNGPMGVFEMEAFAAGTRTVAAAVGDSPATSVVGGGDSLAAIHQLGLADRIDHLSTGGGASLEFVQGLTLPGVAALER